MKKINKLHDFLTKLVYGGGWVLNKCQTLLNLHHWVFICSTWVDIETNLNVDSCYSTWNETEWFDHDDFGI